MNPKALFLALFAHVFRVRPMRSTTRAGRFDIFLWPFALGCLLLATLPGFSQGTAFTYQGRLASEDGPVNDLIDFRVRAYDAQTNGNIVGIPVTTSGTIVSNGTFSITLDFGANVFSGPNRWLEIAARPNGTATFTNLNPRQLLTPAPYAITAAGTPSGAISSLMLAGGAVTMDKIGTGAVTTDKIASGAVKVNHIDDAGVAAYETFRRVVQASGGETAVTFADLVIPSATNGFPPSLTFSAGGLSFGTVIGFSGSEGISQPYSYLVQVQYSSSGVDPATKVGGTGALTYTRNGRSTVFSGIVTSCTLAGNTASGLLYTFKIEPPLAFLKLTTDYRIFQSLKISDVIQSIYTAASGDALTLQLSGSYSAHETLTQYDETTFNFFNRLLEIEGLFYYFDHSLASPELVVCDANGSFKNAPNSSFAYYGDHATNFPTSTDVIRKIQKAAHRSTLSTSVKSYSYLNPNTTLASTSTSSPGTGTNYVFGGNIKTAGYMNATAAWRQQREGVERALISGTATAADLRAGYNFTLTDTTAAGLSGGYIVTAVHHAAFVRVINGVSTVFYGNRFEAIPASIAYRPATTTPRPIAQPSTGVVTGPAGESIHTDSYGRVKVQFHWDRYGAKNDTSSAWMRVAMPMAGTNRAAMFLPRVGDEVLVSFIQGDPDQPVVTGSLFNGAMLPPYQLPNNKQVSAIRTRGTDGLINELKFDDTAGAQKLSLTGARDVTIQASGKTSISTLGNLQSGQAIAGSSSSNSLVVNITFPKAYISTPKVIATPSADPGWNVNDTFSASIRSVTTTGCVVNIQRTDSGNNWSQTLRLNWIAWE